jgi:hypothetical protein
MIAGVQPRRRSRTGALVSTRQVAALPLSVTTISMMPCGLVNWNALTVPLMVAVLSPSKKTANEWWALATPAAASVPAAAARAIRR